MTVPLRNRYPDPATHYVAEWTTTERLARNVDAWRRLVTASVEPNPFYGPDYLLASARLDGRPLRCIAIYRDGAADSDLVGLFPLQRTRILDGFLIPALEFYFSPYICKTTPLVHRDDPEGVWACFLDRCRHTADQPQKIIGRLMTTDGPVCKALEAALTAGNLASATFDAHHRAALLTKARFQDHFARISSQRRSDLRRRRRRMRTDGHSEIKTYSGDAITPELIDAFLKLEASGWKGRAGTALDTRNETRDFALAAFRGPNAELSLLLFNGEPIGADANLIAGGMLHTVKTSYREDMAKYAPGMMLAVQQIRRLSDQPELCGVDSCAQAGHIIESVWTDRLPVASFAFATAPAAGQARIDQMIALIGNIRRLRRWLGQTLRARTGD